MGGGGHRCGPVYELKGKEFQKKGVQDGSSQPCQLCAWPLTSVVSCNLQNSLAKRVTVFPFYWRGSETEGT